MIVKESLQSQAYKHIKRGILNGDFQRRVFYSEQYFADYLNISRTPVREALLRLNRERYVVIYRNRGIMLKDVDRKEIISISQLRSAIEGYCAAYLALHINTPEGRKAFMLCKDICCQEEELLRRSMTHNIESDIEFIDLDLQFHQTINHFPNNDRFLEIMAEINSYVNLLGVSVVRQQERKQESIDENYKILSAIEQANPEEAYHAACYHVDQIHRRYIENYFADDNEGEPEVYTHEQETSSMLTFDNH